VSRKQCVGYCQGQEQNRNIEAAATASQWTGWERLDMSEAQRSCGCGSIIACQLSTSVISQNTVNFFSFQGQSHTFMSVLSSIPARESSILIYHNQQVA